MEKKKLLLVAISVGIFLTIIISVSILAFSPKTSAGSAVSGNQAMIGGRSTAAGTIVTPPVPIAAGTGGNAAAATPSPQPATLDAAELVRNAGGVQNIQTPPSATAVQETNFYINGARPAEAYSVETGEGGAAARVTINVPRPTTAAVPDTSYDKPGQTSPRSSAGSASPATAKPAPAPAKPAAAVKPAAKPPAVQAKPAPQTKTYTDYWIQTGAFSAKTNAEGVKDTLASKGIMSIIENRVIDGKTWYQVRVGPYTTENEAKYWLALVQAIDGFSDSLIRQTKSVR